MSHATRPLRRRARAATLTMLFSLACQSVFADAPKARIDNVVDVYHGVKVTDPYRWLEDVKSAEVQQWMKAQAEHTKSVLQSLPLRDTLLKRLVEVSSASAQVNRIQPRGNRYFYQRRAPDEQDFKLYVRDLRTGKERMLIDPARMISDGRRYSIHNWSVSQDGAKVTYNLSAAGSEQAHLRVLDVATGKDAGLVIERTNFDSGSWLADGRSFFYNRFPPAADNAPQHEKYQKMRAYLHRLGSNPENDRPVFGYGLNPDIEDGIDLIWSVETRRGWNFALATRQTGVSPEIEAFVAPLDALDQVPVPWRRLTSFEDKVAELDINGDELYLRTFKESPRYKIIRTSLAKPDLVRATEVVPQGAGVLTQFAARRDALYVTTLDGGNYRIDRVDYRSNKATPIELPFAGAATQAANDLNTPGIHFSLSSWTAQRAHFRYDPAKRLAVPTGLIPKSSVDMSDMTFVNARARSHDGVMVPLVIIHKKGLVRDGRNPVILNGYGAYGIENTSPVFDPRALPWLERGGVYVWAGIRGGGEFGDAWHRAGFQATKPNSWKDMIACAEYLIAEGYTAPAHLGIIGASAGGLVISNSLAERPDLFGAAVSQVGMSNALRAETTANGLPNVPEFGSYQTEAGFKSLLAMDGYLKIRDGVKYPATMLTHGVNDARVEVWFSTKMAARLQAAGGSGSVVLLRLDYDAGHGAGTTREQQNAELADIYAFMFANLLHASPQMRVRE